MSAIYLIEVDDEKHLVKAGSKSVAINHVVKAMVKARPVTAAEAVELMQGGMTVEEAGKPSAPSTEVKATTKNAKVDLPDNAALQKGEDETEEAVAEESEAA